MDDALYYWFIHVAKTLIWFAEAITDLLFGWTYTRGNREERNLAKYYEHSPHVVSIQRKSWYASHFFQFIDGYLYKHEKYGTP